MKINFRIIAIYITIIFITNAPTIAFAKSSGADKIITSEQFYLNAQEIFSLADTNLDKKLSKAELMNFRHKKEIERAEKAFSQLDQNKNGVLSINEWMSRKINSKFERNSSRRSKVKNRGSRPMILGRDLNSDEFISLEEYNISIKANFLRMDTNSDGVITKHDRFRHQSKNRLK